MSPSRGGDRLPNNKSNNQNRLFLWLLLVVLVPPFLLLQTHILFFVPPSSNDDHHHHRHQQHYTHEPSLGRLPQASRRNDGHTQGHPQRHQDDNRSPLLRSTKPTTTTTIHWGGIQETDSLLYFMKHYWKRNVFCDTVRHQWENHNSNHTSSLLVMKMELGSCWKLHQQLWFGTGNLMIGIYGIRLAALHLGVDLNLTCHDAHKSQHDLILPWLLGYFPASGASIDSVGATSSSQRPKEEAACSTFNHVPVGQMTDSIRFELRKMAVSLVAPPKHHPAYEWRMKQQNQLQQNHDDDDNPKNNRYQLAFESDFSKQQHLELDDTTIHFRGGDLLRTVAHKGYGFLRFDVYVKLIQDHYYDNASAATNSTKRGPRSIGIVTQAFDDNNVGEYNHTIRKNNASSATSQVHPSPKKNRQPRPQQTSMDQRLVDAHTGGRGRILVTALSEHLQKAFPNAQIRIHAGESMPLSYARMILAQQTIGAFSSFAVFPAMATFGTGYLRHPQGMGPYRWITTSTNHHNLVLFEEPDILKASVLQYVWDNLGETILFKWFRNEMTSPELLHLALSASSSETKLRATTNHNNSTRSPSVGNKRDGKGREDREGVRI